MEYDKKNGNVAFRESDHVYFNLKDADKKYTSVTTLIHKYTQQFDKNFWSAFKTLQFLIPAEYFKLEKGRLLETKKIDIENMCKAYDIDIKEFESKRQSILDEWSKANSDACIRGTALHKQMEDLAYDNPDTIVRRYGFGGKFQIKKDYSDLDLKYGLYPEYLIYNDEMGLAGQIDLLIKDDNDITVCDYKGLDIETDIPTIDGWKKMKDINVGDYVFDKDGNSCKVLHKSNTHYNKCYKIIFDNKDEIIADFEHKWVITYFCNSKRIEKIMTTQEIFDYYIDILDSRNPPILKIYNPKPLNLEEKELPIDPYVLGVWLGDGTKSCGGITQRKDSKVWDELIKRGCILGNNCIHDPKRENVATRTIYGLSSKLRQLGLINNKHIPQIYLRASHNQRLDLLRGLMDTDGYFHRKRKRYVMNTAYEWQRDGLLELLATFGIKPTWFQYLASYNDLKKFTAYTVGFYTNLFNAFLTRNQDIVINCKKYNKYEFRNIKAVIPVDTVPTQCIMVDSPSHTYLCTKQMIVTHNSNTIKFESGYDPSIKRKSTMLYPLNNLMDSNYYHYSLQLSTYAYMLQKINPDFNIKKLLIIPLTEKGTEEPIECNYLRKEVELMIKDYNKKLLKQSIKDKYKSIKF